MAAYAALASLMNIIDAIEHHHSPPISIDKQQAQSLSQIITFFHEFLQGYTSPVTEIDEPDPLEMRIAAAAYSAEDIIESRIVNRIPQHRRSGISTGFCNCCRAPKKPENVPLSEDDDKTSFYQQLQRVIEEMESIKKLTVETDARNQRLRFVDAPASSSGSISSGKDSISVTVCSEDLINEVMEKLARGRSDRHAVPVVGMGGIGKTTLARNVYVHPFITEHFDIRAWATISQQFSTREILCRVLSQAANKEREKVSERGEDKLGTELHKCLFGRRYLIVLDDMWSIDAWDKIQRYLPNNDNGSRVLVTTRLSQLSSQLNKNYSLHMKFLDDVGSWDLFTKIVFGDSRSCPLELEKIGKKIVENCRGLPLSIVVVGGILKKTDRTRSSWESIGKNLSSLVNLENDKHCMKLLRMSYSHLPAYLKPCFLYMGVFEEDSEIKVSELIMLWVCEGILKPTNDESLETIAKEFLKDLVDRNLVLVHELGLTGSIKLCKMHDLLRDFCLNESKKEGFYHVIGQSSSQGISGHRRAVVPRSISKEKVRGDLRSMPHVRSIISKYGEVPSCWNFKLLRVVDASKRYHYDGVSRVNLRDLHVKVCCVSSFLSLISLHWNLHRLFVSCPTAFTVPIEIWKMTYVRHIHFRIVSRTQSCVYLPNPPSDGPMMKNLQVLKGLCNFKFGEGLVERIPNIKKLALSYDGNERLLMEHEHEDYYRLSNVRRLCKLESLRVRCWIGIIRYTFLNKLTFPHSLKKLVLSPYLFELNGLLEKIGSLPLLEKLKLWGACYSRDEWKVVEGQFPRLKYLGIFSCNTLKKVTTQEGSAIFPRLELLHLSCLAGLDEIPYEIGEIATLKKISLVQCGASAVECAKVIVEEQVELQGEQLPFHVVVALGGKDEQLLSLAGPYFQVLA